MARVTPAADTDESSLIRAAAGGDQRAFEQLYRANVGRVYALCLRMTADQMQAEECTQMAFVKAWQKLDTFQQRSALSTWLHRIAVNEVLAQKRSDKRRRNYLEVVEELPAGTDVDTRVEVSGSDVDIEQALQSLPEGARQVFVLCVIYGYTHEETASTLDCAVGTTKAQLHRARKLLQARLN
ncbi:MAG: RNA polymerase sigma factor [Gammaproteobacteria bacterium]|nr:RNA polymerase sigma factor [Gammaproteobacteria bacterium]NND59297.1 RNA polymerase sigma factor [Gammaproteobacteria bacterium]